MKFLAFTIVCCSFLYACKSSREFSSKSARYSPHSCTNTPCPSDTLYTVRPGSGSLTPSPCIGKSIGVLTKTSMYSNTPIWLNFSQFVQNGNVYWTPRAFPRLWLAPMLNKKALSDRIGDSALKNHRNESLPRASVATKLWKIGRMNTGEMLLECPTVEGWIQGKCCLNALPLARI